MISESSKTSASTSGNGESRISDSLWYLPLFAPKREPEERRGADRRRRSSWKERRVRALNVTAALLGITITSPIMIAIALAIKLTSRGPVIYRQQRVGLDRRRPTRDASDSGRRAFDRGGRIFTIFKFRTMAMPRQDSGEVWASPNDPRVTRVGAVLRKYRLDELPQLFNVLRGDMNIVGPRPEQPQIFQQLRSEVERYVERQRVPPGITGLAQVNLAYDQTLEDVRRKVSLDLEYIRRRSAAEDLRIMARTIPVMIGKKGSI